MKQVFTASLRRALPALIIVGAVVVPRLVLAQQAQPETTPYQQALKTAGNVPLLLLNPDDKVWSLQVTKGTQLFVRKGNVMVNSAHRGALWAADGSIQVENGAIGVVGGVTRLGNPTIQPEPKTGFQPMPDPFPRFDVPQDARIISPQKLFINNEKKVTLTPGVYVDGIFATGKDLMLTLQPGTYIMRGGDFYVSGGQVQGKDVTIVLMPGQREAGKFSTVFGVKLNLAAPTTGPLQGLAILSAAKGFNAISFQATEGTITGTIYGPQAEMKVSSESRVSVTRAVVSSLGLALGGALEITGADMPAQKE